MSCLNFKLYDEFSFIVIVIITITVIINIIIVIVVVISFKEVNLNFLSQILNNFITPMNFL